MVKYRIGALPQIFSIQEMDFHIAERNSQAVDRKEKYI
jgi:hypothetical protein